MHLSRTILIPGVALVLSLGPGLPRGVAEDEADPVKTFDDVFGESYRKAVSTAATTDDAELARDLAKAITSIEMPASLMRVIVERMTSLTEKAPAALLPTVQAVDKLMSKEKDPTKRAALEMQAITLLEKAHETGDAAAKSTSAAMLIDRLVPLADAQLAQRSTESAHGWYVKAMKLARDINSPKAAAIEAKLSTVEASLKDAREIDALEKRIDANPKDIEARKRLIEIHLVKRDDPSAAIWFASEGIEDKVKKLLPVAAREGANADASTLAELAGWYMDLAEAAAAADKRAMYTRAKGYYQKFLEVHKDNDLLKAKATLSLDQIDRRMKDLASAASATDTPARPGPGSTVTPAPTTPQASEGPGALTVKIEGVTITDPERVERLYAQHWRIVAREYVAVGKEYFPVLGYDAKFPSSAKETLAAAKTRLTTTRIEFVGFKRREVTVPPVPAEAEAVSMALPAITPGAYGYLHSVEVSQILGDDEMVVKNFWMVDRDTLQNVPYDQRKERETLVQRQNEWNWGDNTMRISGIPTAGLKPGERVGIGGKLGKPLQVYIATTERQQNFRHPTRPVAALTSKINRSGIDDTQFADLLKQRNLTRTDLVNIYLQAQRTSLKDAVELTVRRIEAKGSPAP